MLTKKLSDMGSFVKKLVRPASLHRRIIYFIMLCWAVPVILFFIFTTVSYQEGIIDKSEAVMEDKLSNAASFASIRIGDAIALCQRPSYERTWEGLWNSCRKGKISERDYLMEVGSSLKGKFYLDERFRLYAFYQKGAREPDIYSSRSGVSYNSYMEGMNDSVLALIAAGSGYTSVKIMNGRMFIIRNLYTTTDYAFFGTLVAELDKNQVFKDISSEFRENLAVCMEEDGAVLTFSGGAAETAKAGQEAAETGQDAVAEPDWDGKLLETLRAQYDTSVDGQIFKAQNREYNGYLYQKKFDGYHMGIMTMARRRDIYSSLYDMYEIVLLMFALFVPVMVYCIFFLRGQIQRPIRRLTAFSRQMEGGNIGVQMEGEPMPNEEFDYLKNAFNRMSAQVKNLFDSFYTEKLARKDAQIAALQAQINPHFLNNTLEMMNWQARMNQDIAVSRMIEALGTVLDYRMNRANVKEIPLWEELRCIDAYFYIMSMRFGQRLQVEKEIDEGLNRMLVPPLILQPLVENAVVHGVEKVKNGTVKVRVYQKGDRVYVEVHNTGRRLTEEDLKRMRGILKGEEVIPKGQGMHTSIGIRNVNRRIQLVYGEEYGLSIRQEEENRTVSTIVLPLGQDASAPGCSSGQENGSDRARINK